MRDKIKFNTIAIGVIFISVAMLAILKVIYVDNLLFSYTGVRFLGGARVFINDSVIYFSISVLFYLSYLYKTPYIFSIILRSIAFFLLFVYIIDFYVFVSFATHLTITDILKYASYSLRYIQQTHGGKVFILVAFLTLSAAFSVSVIISSFKIQNKLSHSLFIILIAVLFMTAVFSHSISDRYVHSWMYKNVISHNLVIMSERKKYSEEFITSLAFEEKLECLPKTSERPNNIILLMVESLSNYQSSFFSGINNWTPNLDKIASKNMAYNNFYANGFTTEDGEISLLTGQLPIYRPSSYSDGGGNSFDGFFNIQGSLPNFFRKNGYSTEFLTTADLDFSSTGIWARSIGFDYIEGSEHPYYKKWEHFHFKAAPDEALYHRIIERIRNNNGNNLYFVKTVSTHHPFINPETKNKSEAETFKYADKQLGAFYKKLIDINFFNKGMLIIVGDHHAMVPLRHKEIEKFGPVKSSAKVPLVVSYAGRQYLDNQQYQQIDISNSLKGLITGAQHYSNWIGSIFDRKPAKYIAHRRGDNRNIISIISGEEVATVMLDGNNTQITSAYPKSMQAKNEILNKINSVRIKQSKPIFNKGSILGQSKAASLVPRYAVSGCR